jgi:dCMP deaminase
MLDKWDQRFMDLAGFVATWSKDPSTQVGAVIANPKTKRVVSMGFNGFPSLLFAGPVAEGCTLYVTPLPPCARCGVIIIQAGIKRVVSPVPDKSKEPWKTQSEISEQMFLEAGVQVDYVDLASST